MTQIVPGDLGKSNPETLTYIHEPVERCPSRLQSIRCSTLSCVSKSIEPVPDLPLKLSPSARALGFARLALTLPLQGCLASAPFPGEGRHWDNFIWKGSGKRLRFLQLNTPSHDTPKNVFSRTKGNKVMFLPALAEFNPVPTASSCIAHLYAMIRGCFHRRKYRVTSTTPAPGKSATMWSWDWSSQTARCCAPRSGLIHWQHELCSLPAAAGEMVGAGHQTSLGWIRT